MVSCFLDLKCYAESTALITDSGETMSYNELSEARTEIAAHIQHGHLAFCLCENSIGSLVGYCGLLQSKVPTVMLDAAKESGLMEKLIEIYHPHYLWMPAQMDSENFGKLLYEAHNYKLIQYCEAPMNIYPELSIMLTTSGSTGSPKLVRLTENNLRSNAESIAEYLEIDSNERPITTLPMFYSYGLSIINSHLLKGATILLTNKAVVQKEFWTFAKEQHATSIAGVPYTYEMLKKLRFFRMDLPDLHTMTQAGGKLNADIAKEYMEFAAEKGKRFFVMYGQTEATARMSYLPWDKALAKYASIGIAIPRGKFSLIDTDGSEIKESGKDGEMIYEGQNVSLGYAECIADLAKGDENHGVLHTGDIAQRDADGFYYITGRLKRFVKIWGNRCNLDAIEQLVKEITTDCACAGVDDLITVFVTQYGLENKIKNLLTEKTGLYVRAFAVKVIENIPKNASGKVQYNELNNLL